VYTDDAIILDPEESGIDQCIQDLQTTFSVEDEGTIEDYLGVQITKLDDGSFKLAQPQLITAF
jgi:hypothetical protein